MKPRYPKLRATVAILFVLAVLLLAAYAIMSLTRGFDPQKWLAAVAGANGSCIEGGATVASGGSQTFYIVPSVPAGETCASVSQTRSCANGVLSGSNNYTYTACREDANLSNVRANLKKFLPYVWSVTWYPWFSNALRTDPANRGLALFKTQIGTIKAQGFNTVWLGGFAWFYLQPTPGVWNEKALSALKAHLDVLKENNMRAIIQLNYVGPGYAPQGISGCTWMNDPAQVQKFDDFVTGLGGELARYNYMIYYSVFTEQTNGCLAARGQYNLYKGLQLSADGSTSVPVNVATQQAAHDADVHAVNQMLKQSVGRVTKYLPSAVRKQMFIGIHDALISRGQITDDGPAENPIDFDFFSFVHYPNYSELAAFPSDAQIASSTTAYGIVFDALETDRKNVRRLYPDVPLLLGEFGWDAWDPVAKQPTLKQDSPARNLAHTTMVEWSVLKKIGFNVWGWLPLNLDNPSDTPYGMGLSLTMPDANLKTSSPTLTSVLAAIKGKLTGSSFANPCAWNGKSIASGSSVTAYKAASADQCVSETRSCTNGTLSGSYQYTSCTVTATTPSPAASLSASCTGPQATFSWSPVADASGYYLNVYDATLGQYVKGPNAAATSPATVATTPGHTYTSWFYYATSAGWSSAIGATPIVCPAS